MKISAYAPQPAPVERMFSMAGFINNPTRNKLSDITFVKLDF